MGNHRAPGGVTGGSDHVFGQRKKSATTQTFRPSRTKRHILADRANDAIADPKHEEHDRLREWYGGPYNAADIDERFTRRAVAAIAIRHHAGKLAYQKSRAQ